MWRACHVHGQQAAETGRVPSTETDRPRGPFEYRAKSARARRSSRQRARDANTVTEYHNRNSNKYSSNRQLQLYSAIPIAPKANAQWQLERTDRNLVSVSRRRQSIDGT